MLTLTFPLVTVLYSNNYVSQITNYCNVAVTAIYRLKYDKLIIEIVRY
jgi:hypothetical protein